MRKKRGLDDWFGAEKWVDISAPKKGGGFKDCGRDSAKDSSRGYPKCVPSAKASSMSKKQIASAVSRKRAKKQGVGGKPTNVKTLKNGGGIMATKAETKAKSKDLKDRAKITNSAIAAIAGKETGAAINDKERTRAIEKLLGLETGATIPKAELKRLGLTKNKGGSMRSKGGMRGGMMKTKGMAKGGSMKTKGMAKGGAMKTKGMAKGGVARTKGSVKGGARKPSSKNSGLYGRR